MRVILVILLVFSLHAQGGEEYGYEDGHFMTLQILRSFNEPIVFEVYWDHVSHNPNIYTLKTTIFSGKGGYKWGVKRIEQQRKLTQSEFESISKFIRLAQDLGMDDEYSSKDGSMWYLEVNKYSRYYKVGIQSPMQQSVKRGSEGIVNLGNQLIKLAGISDELGHLY
jgi:hypothetical protein